MKHYAYSRLNLILILFTLLSLASCKEALSQVPVLKIATEGNEQSVRLESLHTQVRISGNIASTVMTMTFRNSSNRILEGELTFPLPEGVSVSRYALDINGKMREAVPVEKAKATEVFEDVEHRRVDPGLLEKVEGNNFRTRIYPLPAGGTRKVLIAYEQELRFTAQKTLTYRLPLNYKTSIPSFSLKVTVFESSQKPELSEQPDGSFSFNSKGNTYIAEMTRKDYNSKHSLVLNLPKGNDVTESLMQQAGDSYYFLSNIFMDAPSRPHAWSKNIGLIWDVSLSGLQRDHEKELDLLDAFIRKRKNLTIELGLLNHEFKAAGIYTIKNGDWTMLREKLTKLVYDGGTDYSSIHAKALNADEYLFFTDGLSGFGENKVPLGKPVYTICSAVRADFSQLNRISQQSGAKFINLVQLSAKEALEQLENDELQLIGVKKGAGISELYPGLPAPVRGNLSISGISASADADLVLQFGFGKQVWTERKLNLHALKQDAGMIDVSRIWAQKKLSAMDLDYEKNKAEITSLGQQFGIVTRNTSLLVLENLEDYIRYDIQPPAELKKEYDLFKKEKRTSFQEQKKDLMPGAFSMAAELKTWWSKVFKPGKVFPKPNRIMEGDPSARADMAAAAPVASVQNVVIRGASSAPRTARYESEARSSQSLSEVVVTRKDQLSGKVSGLQVLSSRGARDNRPEIVIPEFKSDKDYIKKLKGDPDQVYEQYLGLRKDYQTTPSFYLDMANWFYQHKDAQRGLMILSNLTELELENAEIYKSLAYKLKQTGNYQKELFISRKIMEWRPMEAQSYRDYALALADCGSYQAALDTLYGVLNKNYNAQISNRDRGIEEIILSEINNLVRLHGAKLNSSKIDKKLLFDLAVEVRVVLNWNKNDTDIDLWVTDPNQEKCFYSNKSTAAGGRISADVTRGYGPEQFMIKKAVRGKYKIEVNYYGDSQLSISGPTTVMAEIYTHYGTAAQQRKIITLQLSNGQNGGVLIGEFSF
ncbi:VIT domain-containing protein [Pedobacter nutrimenti]|uniref:Uncharacterized protein YfaP (DUF2135 family) n=1 Tax=Pedobacter nutrimenti TaxID=1241337 RepID=A0A318UNV4_9SPHI|nr:VIT domain-containing protein [Pedobacter nutrimenti]PYF77220.1 uncharacterized protein YfaP (DUF2135 family) [Pedobacter nutrimenti]